MTSRAVLNGRLSQEQIKALDERAARIRAHARATTKAIIEIGRELIEVKRLLPHGAFTKWVTVDCGFTMRSAQNFMRSAEFMHGKSEMVALLAPGAVYRLSAKNAPKEVVADVLRLIEAGQVPTECEVADMIAARTSKRPEDKRPQMAVGDRQEAAALASEILSRLGPELTRRLIDSRWDLVLECLREQLDEEVFSPPDAGVGSPPDAGVGASASPLIKLVRDPSNPDSFRAQVTEDESRKLDIPEDLSIPSFLDRTAEIRQPPLSNT